MNATGRIGTGEQKINRDGNMQAHFQEDIGSKPGRMFLDG